MTDNGWNEYKKLVVDTLDRLECNIKELNNKVDKLSEQVVVLKVKASIWGGAIALIVTALLNFILNK